MKMKNRFKRKIIAFFSPRLKVEYSTEDPDIISNGKLFIIGDYGFQWRAIMKCPCGCGDTIYLNIDGQTSPSWKIYGKKKIPSIWPSINRRKGCKAHFFVKNGKIKWAN